MVTSKIKIDLNARVAELEGDEAFVSAQLEKLLPLLQASTSVQADSDDRDTEPNGSRAPRNSSEPGKKKRKSANPPQGASCRARILELKKDGFFKSHRSPNDIVSGLKAKGWTHANNQVGAALTNVFAKAEIQRTGADGKFMYFWDRS